MIKILFASVDIGWRISNYTCFLKKKSGSKSLIKSFVKRGVPKEQYYTSYDYHFKFHTYPSFIRWGISFLFFLYALLRFNTFYFLSGENILTRKTRKFEFFIYKLLGKKIIMHFVGSDIRDTNYLFWKENHIIQFLNGNAHRKLTADWQDLLIADSKQFADKILVSTPDLLKIIPEATYYPVMIDVDQFRDELEKHKNQKKTFFKTNKIKILHAPSNVKTKGSLIIDAIVKKLAEEDDRIEFIYTKDLNRETGLVYTVSRYELFQLYQEADIVIDQLIIGWYGLQSVEALLAKCQVLCYIEEGLKKYLYENCPIVPTDAIHLEKDLRKVIQNAINGHLDFNSQQEWVEKYHSLKNNNKALLSAFEI